MATYQEKQHRLIESIEENFRSKQSSPDIVSMTPDYISDPRRCLTIVHFLPQSAATLIADQLITPLKAIDPHHHYYSYPSFHLTIKTIRRSADPVNYTQNDIEKVRQMLPPVVANFPSVEFKLRGLFETPVSLAIRGYSDESLFNIISTLDASLKNIDVPDNKHYASDEVFFGNVTFCRYTQPPSRAFIDKVRDLKSIPLGDLLVDSLSLITANPVCTPDKTTRLGEYPLAK